MAEIYHARVKQSGTNLMSGFGHEHFINRELSWLEFNQRVLDEALDPANPLLERLKFFTIVSSNLDEFFEVRVAGLKQEIESGQGSRSVDGLTARETFQELQPKAGEEVFVQLKNVRIFAEDYSI